MNKKEIKNLLMSMRTSENESAINNLLGRIDLLTDETIKSMVAQIGNNEGSIRTYLQRKLDEIQGQSHEEHTQINEMFSYGIAGSSIHLHMPVDLHKMMSEKGISKTVDTVNLQLLDAIERIRKLQNDGYHKFAGKDSIYMISPILSGREIRFLSDLDFKTQTYRKRELQDHEFVSEHPEAQLAIHIFGKDSNVGTAIIGLDVINSAEWQEKRQAKVKEFEEKGIVIDENNKCIE